MRTHQAICTFKLCILGESFYSLRTDYDETFAFGIINMKKFLVHIIIRYMIRNRSKTDVERTLYIHYLYYPNESIWLRGARLEGQTWNDYIFGVASCSVPSLLLRVREHVLSLCCDVVIKMGKKISRRPEKRITCHRSRFPAMCAGAVFGFKLNA